MGFQVELHVHMESEARVYRNMQPEPISRCTSCKYMQITQSAVGPTANIARLPAEDLNISSVMALYPA